METVPLKDLKENLAYWAETAAHGKVLEVTKHNKPYVMLVPCQTTHVRVGKNVGASSLVAVLKKDPTRGAWLVSLQEDRDD